MRRIHLFEIEDQSWLPNVFRNILTDFLKHLNMTFGFYTAAIPLIERVLAQIRSKHIIDLCSGASGPWVKLTKEMDIFVTLTDKYPNLEAFQQIVAQSDGKIGFIEESVDATDVPSHLDGMRTIFSGFHHFRPDVAKAILYDAARKRKAIGIFEFTERNLRTVLTTPILFPLLIIVLTPFIRPVTFSRFFWTYIIPIALIIPTFDGVVSHLRSYSPEELKEMVSSIASERYKWEIGQVATGVNRRLKLPITYLIGYPID